MLSALEQQGIRCTSQQWPFTLKQLHQLTQSLPLQFPPQTYQQFRQSLFNSQIAQQLTPLGAKIIIIQNTQKVDQNIYALDIESTT